MNISKEDAIKWFGNLNDETIIKIYRYHYKRTKAPEAIEAPKNIIDKTTEKYKLVLKYANAILSNITGTSQITDLTEFINIEREQIIKDENQKVLDKMEKELFEHFDKFKHGYYRRTVNSVFNYLKGMCKTLGLTLVGTKKDIVDKINGINYRRTGYLYTIKNI